VVSFSAPQWFALLPALALLGWAVPALRLWKPLRISCLALLVLWMTGLEILQGEAGVEVIVLADRSESAEEAIAPRLAEWEELLRDGMARGDRLRWIDFAETPVERVPNVEFESGRNATQLRLALEYARSVSDPKRATRVVVFSDGYSTQPLDDSGIRMADAGIEVSFRRALQESGADSRVLAFDLPEQVRRGEGFLISVEVATAAPEVPYVLSRDGVVIGEGVIEAPGSRRLSFVDQIASPGSHEYRFELVSEGDAFPSNNVGRKWIELTGGDRIVVVTGYERDPFIDALRVQRLEVEQITDYSRLGPGTLTRAEAVVFNNVPASEVPAAFLEALPFYLLEQGGGLLMIGGEFSFGSGGYFGSALDPLLPVSMELKEDLRKTSTALSVVLDRSGSMSAGVAGGMTKMDLANEGAARAIELLGPRDLVSVHAVDSFAHQIVPLSRTDDSKFELADQVRRIESGGGGIFVYTGMNAGWTELNAAGAERKHLILFADALDAEEPGQYVELLAEMRESNATVSVIALGEDTDADAGLLRDIAELGGGRIFFNADPSQLPALFSMETVAVARSMFIEQLTDAEPTGAWLEISPQDLDWPAQIDGYNLSYLRPEAVSALNTTDEYGAPLVSWWNRGAGRAGAVSFPVAGKASAAVRAWPEYGEFLRTFLDWLAGLAQPEGSLLRTRVEGNELQLDLYLDASWTERLTSGLPRLVVAAGAGEEIRELVWTRHSPGRLQASIQIPPGEFLRGVASLGEERWTFGPISGAADPEMEFDPKRWEELIEVARITGGGELVRFGSIWERDGRRGSRELGPLLLVGLLGTFLAEMLVLRFRGS